MIPIYGRGGDHQDPRKKAVKDDWNRTESVPQRPAGRRPALIQVTKPPIVLCQLWGSSSITRCSMCRHKNIYCLLIAASKAQYLWHGLLLGLQSLLHCHGWCQTSVHGVIHRGICSAFVAVHIPADALGLSCRVSSGRASVLNLAR